jgi:uncharacterized phage protein (TIGR02220 family)
MAKLRSVSTTFWSDPFIEKLSPKDKLLFLYLITNEKTNMLGVYENTIKKMSFETGLPSNEVETILKRLEGFGKVKYINNWVMLVNYMKHQNYNPNMKKSAIDCYNELPNELKIKDLVLDRDKPLEAFETLSKYLGIVRKSEYKLEDELEDKGYIDFCFFIDSLNSILGKKFTKAKKYRDSFKARVNDGYSVEQMLTAIKNAKADNHHVDTGFMYLTPEFILRVDKLERFLNISNSILPDKEYIDGKEIITEKSGRRFYWQGDRAIYIYPPRPDFTGWTKDEIYNYVTHPHYDKKVSDLYESAIINQSNTTEAEKRGKYKYFYDQDTLQIKYANHDNVRTS